MPQSKKLGVPTTNARDVFRYAVLIGDAVFENGKLVEFTPRYDYSLDVDGKGLVREGHETPVEERRSMAFKE